MEPEAEETTSLLPVPVNFSGALPRRVEESERKNRFAPVQSTFFTDKIPRKQVVKRKLRNSILGIRNRSGFSLRTGIVEIHELYFPERGKVYPKNRSLIHGFFLI